MLPFKLQREASGRTGRAGDSVSKSPQLSDVSWLGFPSERFQQEDRRGEVLFGLSLKAEVLNSFFNEWVIPF